MTKDSPEMMTWPAGARAEGQKEVASSLDEHLTSAALSEQAVDAMLETAKGATAHTLPHEFELQRVIHDAAVEAARDGECTPAEECEPPHHYSYRYEVTDPWATERSPDGFAERGIEILD